MTRQTRLWFLAGLFVTVLLVPVVAVAVTSPSTVSEGTTFNATDGPTVVLGEDDNLNTSQPFPANDTVSLGAANISGDELRVRVTGLTDSQTVLNVSNQTVANLTLARDDAALSVAGAGGGVDTLALDAGADLTAGRDLTVAAGPTAADVEVRGLSGPDAVSFIDSDTGGRFDAAVVSGGTATVEVAANTTRNIEIAQGVTNNTGISGTVVDAQGDPVPGATVTTNQTGGSVPVNSQGQFALNTSAGSFAVFADAPGFRSDTVSVSVTAGNVTSGVTLQLEDVGVPIAGTVTDPNGVPIDGADVFVGSNQTQTNLQGNYAVEVAGTGTFVVTAATSVDSKTRTVTVSDPNGTSGVGFVLQTPSSPGGGGGDANITGNLELRFENTGGLVNNRSVTVRFFDDSKELVATRNTTTGVVGLASLSQPAPLVAVAEADGLFSRRVILDENGVRTLFLLDESKATGEVVINEFEVRDNTGRFSGGDTRFVIKRAMPLPGETDDIPLRVLGSDLLGADGRFGIALESDVRYRIQLVNDDGDVRDLGPHVVTSAGVVVLEIGEVSFEREDGGTFSVGADATVTDDGGGGQPVTEITFRYDDPARLTEQVSVRIYNRSDESQVIVDQTVQPPNGSFGNLTVRKLVLGGGNASADWTVEYSIVRANDTREGEITVTGRSKNLNIPMSQGLQQVLGVGMVIIVGGLFSRRNAAVGAVIVPLLAGALFLVGALSGVVTGAAVAFALTLGVGYNFATRGS